VNNHFFQIPTRDSAEAERELNQCLSTHRVLAVDRRWVDLGENSFWAICVDCLDRSIAPTSNKSGSNQRPRIDYKELLSPQEFARFAELRNLRKELAGEDGVPVYTVFTNEQLAQIVQQGVSSKSELQKIDGVGESRVEKYGERLLNYLQAGRKEGETSEESVSTDP
jgi:superfamily II DNA helicase RecQ